ncbi:cell division protein FtsZ [Vibrio tapetis]|uniref:Cell division protein FtsZ (Modular protein) n=1 Tax=Vibrio tapetis subsp. tapetis TaxID=1671868 RepID=A0A2N8ZM02_9VIBR|nr:cell division protein FtsZ [Vibrio tapetis]SON52938.1 Cell division protein FtsZ (modular protein) [Vibrio tapetis subsp. tapetis]
MFEPMMEMDELLGTIVGVGSVGCKIVNNMKYVNSQDTLGVIDKLYVHTSSEVLNRYSNIKHDLILLDEHIHFMEKIIRDKLSGKDVVFLVAGLGGETGSLVPQHIARIAKELGILCVGLFSFPFSFEGRSKKLKSQQAYLSLSKYTDSLLCIENDRFLDSNLKTNSLNGIDDLFQDANNHFYAVIKGLVNLISRPGMINVDFSDVRQILTKMGLSTVGYSLQEGEKRAEVAVAKLLDSPALQHYELSKAKAKGYLINITAGLDMRLDEFEAVGNAVKNFASDSATVVIGTSLDPNVLDAIEVTIILTGLPELPIDKNIESDGFDVVKLFKSITFEAHQASAGLAILSYFNDFLHQKFSGIEAKVSIEQSDNMVCLLVETPSGDVEKIEKSLHEFGLVIVGDKKPTDVLESKLDIERLQMKLEMAAMELRQNERLLLLYQCENDNYKSRVGTLEEQMIELQRSICNSLTKSQNHLSSQLSTYEDLPQSLLTLLEVNATENISVIASEKIEEEVRCHITDSHKALSLKEFANNTLYGVAGNSLYSLIISVLATLPK